MLLDNKTISIFLYFLIQYTIYSSFILLINKGNISVKKYTLNMILVLIFSATVETLLITISPILHVLNILILLAFSKVFYKMDSFSSLIFAIICSIITFSTNLTTYSFGLASFTAQNVLCKLLISIVISYIMYKYLYNKNIDYFIYKYEDCIYNNTEIYFIFILLVLSFDFALLPNVKDSYISLLIQGILTFELFKSIYSKAIIKHLNLTIKQMELEYDNLKSSFDNIRIFKHDYGNTLCSLGGYISLSDMTGLKNFYTKITNDYDKTNNMQKISTKLINEPSIYNLFASKYNVMKRKNLKFDFYSNINFQKLNISPYEFTKILGIFLDNAIEASKLSSEKEIAVICEKTKDNKYQILIKNSYINKDVNIENIYKKGYSSKKVKSGLGLWEVSKLIKNIPNLTLSTEKNDDYFIQKLTVT